MAVPRNGNVGQYDSDDDTNGDTIRVASAMVLDTDDEDNPLVGLEKAERREMQRQHHEAENTSYAGKGKGKAKDLQEAQTQAQTTTKTPDSDGDIEMVNNETDEEVEEYTFSTEDEDSGDEDNFDKQSVISLSSDDATKPEVPGIDERPWRNMNDEQRLTYESMFGTIHTKPLGPDPKSWSFTEEYQKEQDKMMGRYIDDFALADWVSKPDVAFAAFKRYEERNRLRFLATKVFPATRDRHQRQQQQPYMTAHGVPTLPHAGPPSAHQHGQSQPGPPYGPPPPQQMLRSQPHARPMDVPPGMQMGPPANQPPGHPHQRYFVPNGMPPPPPGMMYAPPQHQQMRPPPHAMYPGNSMPPPRQVPSNPRRLKLTVANPYSSRPNNGSSSARPFIPPMQTISSPPPSAPVPPYPTRERPDDRRTLAKTGRGKMRRQAEAEEYPWNRQLDFNQARIASHNPKTWDDSIYPPQTLVNMAQTRSQNELIYDRLEEFISEKQRLSRNAKKKAVQPEVGSDIDTTPRKKGGRKKIAGDSGPANDPYHSGNFAFVTAADKQLAAAMGKNTVEELIKAGENDQLPLDELSRINICWSPGKKGNQQDLQQAVFSVKDSVVTRKQLDNTPILNHRAAECIIDFRPDLLWREILLRILSEGCFSNKDVRDRFCLNGCFSDRATVAKRLGAALGKDTNNPKGKTIKGKDGQEENAGDKVFTWANLNRKDYFDYQQFFGKKPPPVRVLKPHTGKKRVTAAAGDSSEGGEESESSRQPSAKRVKFMPVDGASDNVNEENTSEAEGESGAEDEEEDEQEADADAVSLQNSDDLDAMSD